MWKFKGPRTEEQFSEKKLKALYYLISNLIIKLQQSRQSSSAIKSIK